MDDLACGGVAHLVARVVRSLGLLAGNCFLVKTGIAFAIFIIPGAYLVQLLSQGDDSVIRKITSGFVISHLIFALLGMAGRFLHLPFRYAKIGFLFLGIIFIAANFLEKDHSQRNRHTARDFLFRALSYWPLVITASLAVLMTIQRVITSDDLAYLAHITNWQHMPGLNFSDVYFKTNAIESTRFWIVSMPFSQAFLADVSNTHGLILLSGYVDPFLALISIFCFYTLARTLGILHHLAMASVGVQVAFLALLADYLHPGSPFFHQLSTDKATAAFIFAPVFISSAIRTVEKTGKGATGVFLLIGISLAVMHPIIAAYAVFIVSGIAILGIHRGNYKRHLTVIVLALLMLMPQVGVRLVKHEAQPTIPTVSEAIAQTKGVESLIARMEGTPFYGFNPRILEMRIPYADRIPMSTSYLSWIWLLIPLLGIFVIIKGLRNDSLHQYVFAATALVVLAGIPFTGWVLGYFVSAWMLERTTWLYPFGISAILLFMTLKDSVTFRKRIGSPGFAVTRARFSSFAWFSIWVLSSALVLLVIREHGLPNINRLEESTRRYQELVSVGQHIDKSAPFPINMIASDELNDFIPALSWKSKVISYRPEDPSYPYFYSQDEKAMRWSDRQAILSPEISPLERVTLLQKYDIRYILIEAYRFGKVKELISTYPTHFKLLPFGRYLLIEINDLGAYP